MSKLTLIMTKSMSAAHIIQVSAQIEKLHKPKEANYIKYNRKGGQYHIMAEGIMMSKTISRNFRFKTDYANEKLYLEKLRKESELALTKKLPGRLKIHRKNGRTYYRISFSGESNSNNVSEKAYITKVIRRTDPLLPEYISVYCSRKMLPVVRRCISTLKNHAELYDPSLITSLSGQFEKDFGMMTPKTYWSNALWIQRWQKAPYQTNTKEAENNYTFKTARGELVRSKNECIAADILFHWQIPYKYEYPVRLVDGRSIFVDFKILNPITLKEWYLEILGKMDDPEYAKSNLKRINNLSEVGVQEGKNLLLMFDYPDVPFNTDTFRAMIKNVIT